MTNEVTKTIWGGLISSTGTVGGATTLRQQATDKLNSGTPVTSTDISRAAAAGVTLGASIPSTNALLALSDDISNSNLVSTLNSFLSLYSQIRVFTFHRNRTSWSNGNGAAVTPDYNKSAFKTNPSVSTGSVVAPAGAYDDIEEADVIDVSAYEAIIATLRGVITTNSTTGDVTVNYCHSSCHSVCHGSRGRR